MQRTSMMGLLLAATLVLGACGQSQSTVADSTEQRTETEMPAEESGLEEEQENEALYPQYDAAKSGNGAKISDNMGDDSFSKVFRSVNPNGLSVVYVEHYTKDPSDWKRYLVVDETGHVYSEIEDGFLGEVCDGKYLLSNNVLRDLSKTIDEAYIVPTFCDNGEEIVEMYQDETGGTIWTVQKVDTIEGSEIIIRARSPIDYEVKLTLSTNDETFANETMSIEDIYTALTDDYPRYGRGIDHVDGPIYYFYTSTTGYIMNVKTGKTFAYDGKYGTPIVYYENGITQVLSSNTLVEYYEFYDEDGNKIFRGDTGILGDGLVYINQNQEGLFNSFGTDTIGFYDIRTGQCVIDLSQYTVTSSPSFVNGYAMINLKNPDDQDFWGILSKDGTWRLEPRKGKGKKFKTLMEFGLVQTEDGIFDFDGNDVSERFGNAQFEESIYNNMMIKNGCLYATVNNGKTYTDKRCRIIKVDGDYNVTYLS